MPPENPLLLTLSLIALLPLSPKPKALAKIWLGWKPTPMAGNSALMILTEPSPFNQMLTGEKTLDPSYHADVLSLKDAGIGSLPTLKELTQIQASQNLEKSPIEISCQLISDAFASVQEQMTTPYDY